MNDNQRSYACQSKIHILRSTRRMSQKELADMVGVSRQTISSIELNRNIPSVVLAHKIAKVFGVSIEALFDFQEESDRDPQKDGQAFEA